MFFRCTVFYVFLYLSISSCFSCTTGCIDCTSTGLCTSCASNYLSIEQMCTVTKTNPYDVMICYYSCVPCSVSAHCKSCSGSSTSCTNCTRGYCLSGTSCYLALCLSRCTNCTNSSVCVISVIIGIISIIVMIFICVFVCVLCVCKRRVYVTTTTSRSNENAMSA